MNDCLPAIRSPEAEPAGYSRRRFLAHALSAGIYAGFGSASNALAQAAMAVATPAANPMAYGRASRTAQGAAILRAAHQLLDEPRVLNDPFALRVIGGEAEDGLRWDPHRYDERRALRAFIALRSRYAEDELATAFAQGVRQYVVLGAGLDTYAYRNPHGRALRVFEVDHPATQRWKRQRLKEAGVGLPGWLTFAPVDFERQTLAESLDQAGFNAHDPAFLSMLGVVIYLTRPAIDETLRFILSLPAGSEIVFDYGIPSSALTESQRRAREASAKRVRAIGEPWITYFDPASIEADLRQLGFDDVKDLKPQEANRRYFRDRADGLRVASSSHLMRARV